MEKATTRNEIVAKAYEDYHKFIVTYIDRRINNHEDAEDLTQELFIRLLNYSQLICEDTLKSFLFTMAHNMLTDYYRHHARQPQMSTYTYDVMNKPSQVTPLEELYAVNLEEIEAKLIKKLSPKCRKVYYMSRFQEKRIDEMATELDISPRTIERQQYLGRAEIRKKLRAII